MIGYLLYDVVFYYNRKSILITIYLDSIDFKELSEVDKGVFILMFR